MKKITRKKPAISNQKLDKIFGAALAAQITKNLLGKLLNELGSSLCGYESGRVYKVPQNNAYCGKSFQVRFVTYHTKLEPLDNVSTRVLLTVYSYVRGWVISPRGSVCQNMKVSFTSVVVRKEFSI